VVVNSLSDDDPIEVTVNIAAMFRTAMVTVDFSPMFSRRSANLRYSVSAYPTCAHGD
jgi:hypothetical protein